MQCCSRLQCVAAGCTAATLTQFTDEKYNECAKRDTYIVKRDLCESKETYVCVSQKRYTNECVKRDMNIRDQTYAIHSLVFCDT